MDKKMKGTQSMLFCYNYIKLNLERNTTEPNTRRCFCDLKRGSQMIYDTTKQLLETWGPIKILTDENQYTFSWSTMKKD